jgi:hypothetical protein
MDLTEEFDVALLTNLENKDGIDRSQITAADHTHAFDQMHPDTGEEILPKEEIDIKELLMTYMTGKELVQTEPCQVPNYTEEEKIADNQEVDDNVRKEKAVEAWDADMKQQDESMRLQLAAMALYIEDRTVDVDPNKQESIIHDSDAIITKACFMTETCLVVLGLDNIREIVMACEMPNETRFAVFMLLKTLNKVIDMTALEVCLLRQSKQYATFSCQVIVDVLADKPLTNEFAQDMTELFEPLSIRFDRHISYEKATLYRLSIQIEKS